MSNGALEHVPYAGEIPETVVRVRHDAQLTRTRMQQLREFLFRRLAAINYKSQQTTIRYKLHNSK